MEEIGINKKKEGKMEILWVIIGLLIGLAAPEVISMLREERRLRKTDMQTWVDESVFRK